MEQIIENSNDKIKSQKITRGLKCLYGVMGITVLTSVYHGLQMYQLLADPANPPGMGYERLVSAVNAYQLIILILGFIFASQLKRNEAWGWVGTLLVLLISIPSFAMPFAVIGILNLLDVRVRESYINELDINLGI